MIPTGRLRGVLSPTPDSPWRNFHQKIGELERSDISRLMKVKEMLEEAEKIRLGK